MNAVLELLPSGHLIAKPETVGTSDEELAAFVRGELPRERIDEINANLRRASEALAIHTWGRC